MKLNNNDLLIIKNSSNWASKSISKLRLYFDKVFGDIIKSILQKTIQINSILEDSLDDFVSGSFSEADNSKTVKDHKAISEFIMCGNNYNNIAAQITSIVLPTLGKLNVRILSEDIFENLEDLEKKPTEEKFNKEETISSLESLIEDLYNIAVIDLNEDESNELIEKRNELIKIIEQNIETIKSSSSKDQIKNLYDKTENAYDSFKENYKKNLSSVAKGVFSELIKHAKSNEEATYYYLISLGSYGNIRTPLKEKLLVLKKFLGRSGDDLLYYLRLDCINYTKLLIKKSSWVIDEIEKSIAIKDYKQKWINIIKALNEFAVEYNRYRRAYIELFSAIKIKSNENKLQTIKKRKDKIDKPILEDFINHSWVDMPAKADGKFPKAGLITP